MSAPSLGLIIGLITKIAKESAIEYGALGIVDIRVNATKDGIEFELSNGTTFNVPITNTMLKSVYDTINDGTIGVDNSRQLGGVTKDFVLDSKNSKFDNTKLENILSTNVQDAIDELGNLYFDTQGNVSAIEQGKVVDYVNNLTVDRTIEDIVLNGSKLVSYEKFNHENELINNNFTNITDGILDNIATLTNETQDNNVAIANIIKGSYITTDASNTIGLLKTDGGVVIDASTLGQNINDIENENITQNNAITALTNENVAQNDKITAIEGVNTNQNTKISNFETESVSQGNRISTLENTSTSQSNSISSLVAKDVIHDNKILALENDNIVQTTKITNLELSDTSQNMKLTSLDTTTKNIISGDYINVTPNSGLSIVKNPLTGVELKQLIATRNTTGGVIVGNNINLGVDGEISIADYILLSQRGTSNGVASLDVNSKIPNVQLDLTTIRNVAFYATVSAFPIQGVFSVLYISDDGFFKKWNGSAYVDALVIPSQITSTYDTSNVAQAPIASAIKPVIDSEISLVSIGKTKIGSWDASTNTPTLSTTPSISLTKGDYYEVSVDGTQFGVNWTFKDRIVVGLNTDGSYAWFKANLPFKEPTDYAYKNKRQYFQSLYSYASRGDVSMTATDVTDWVVVGATTIATTNYATNIFFRRMLSLVGTSITNNTTTNLYTKPTAYAYCKYKNCPTSGEVLAWIRVQSGDKVVAVNAWLRNPTTGVLDKRLWTRSSQLGSVATTGLGAIYGELYPSHDNRAGNTTNGHSWICFRIDATDVPLYRTATGEIHVAFNQAGILTTGGNSGNIGISGWALSTNEYNFQYLTGNELYLPFFGSTYKTPAVTNGTFSLQTVNSEGYVSVFIPSTQSKIFEVPMPSTITGSWKLSIQSLPNNRLYGGQIRLYTQNSANARVLDVGEPYSQNNIFTPIDTRSTISTWNLNGTDLNAVKRTRVDQSGSFVQFEFYNTSQDDYLLGVWIERVV